MSAYNETCAAIASFQWCWRLLLATGDAKYADHMERVLYNGFGSAIATEGQRFFYVNPLQRREDHFEKDDPGRRRVWFNCACCPPNIMSVSGPPSGGVTNRSPSSRAIPAFVPAHMKGGISGRM